MHKYILFLTDYCFRLPQKLRWYQSFDLPVIFSILRENGYFPIVTHYEDPNLFSLINDLQIEYCVPATFYLLPYREMIQNKLIALHRKGIKFLPEFELMMAFENKGLQSDFNELLDLHMPESHTVSSKEAFHRYASNYNFPFVVKNNAGYASSGVFLVRDPKEQEAISIKLFSQQAAGTNGLGSIIIQKLIPDLEGDWKIILIGNTAAALYRKVRPNDFRASGSGMFEFLEPSQEILTFVDEINSKLHAPWISLDIAQKDNKFYLLEFQATHFGTYTIDKAPFYYAKDDNNQWKKISKPYPIEQEMANAILKRLN